MVEAYAICFLNLLARLKMDVFLIRMGFKKSCMRETLILSTNADSRTNSVFLFWWSTTFFQWVLEGVHSFFWGKSIFFFFFYFSIKITGLQKKSSKKSFWGGWRTNERPWTDHVIWRSMKGLKKPVPNAAEPHTEPQTDMTTLWLIRPSGAIIIKLEGFPNIWITSFNQQSDH